MFDFFVAFLLVKRAAENKFKDVDEKLVQFGQCFKDLKSAFLERTELRVEQLVWTTWNDVKDLSKDIEDRGKSVRN